MHQRKSKKLLIYFFLLIIISSINNISLKKGIKYSICSCGISKRLPFCDGRHKILNENGDQRRNA